MNDALHSSYKISQENDQVGIILRYFLQKVDRTAGNSGRRVSVLRLRILNSETFYSPVLLRGL